jgi:thiol-disulfide isomerase/thioredoxin
MNKVILGIAMVAILGIGGYFLLGRSGSGEQKVSNYGQLQDKTEDVSIPSSSERYVIYSDGVLDSSTDKRRILFFYANWCPTCRPADSDILKNVSEIPDDVLVIRVNYNDSDTDDEEKSLASKYGITYQHTYVQIDPEGNEVSKWNGGATNELLRNIK